MKKAIFITTHVKKTHDISLQKNSNIIYLHKQTTFLISAIYLI